MICWSSRKHIPDAATFCHHCEAKVEVAPSVDEQSTIETLLANMSPDMIADLRLCPFGEGHLFFGCLMDQAAGFPVEEVSDDDCTA